MNEVNKLNIIMYLIHKKINMIKLKWLYSFIFNFNNKNKYNIKIL